VSFEIALGERQIVVDNRACRCVQEGTLTKDDITNILALMERMAIYSTTQSLLLAIEMREEKNVL
jgi:hypothetical protein